VPTGAVAGVDAGEVLASGWHLVSGEGVDFGQDAVPALPYRSWPGLADPATPGADPDEHAARLARAPGGVSELTGCGEPPYLGLVPASDGAAAIAACGWLSPAGGAAETAAVVRSWQDRFGARLCSLGIDTLVLSVAWPPVTSEHARRVAAEHLAFCHDLVGLVEFDEYAEALTGASTWSFWWH